MKALIFIILIFSWRTLRNWKRFLSWCIAHVYIYIYFFFSHIIFRFTEVYTIYVLTRKKTRTSFIHCIDWQVLHPQESRFKITNFVLTNLPYTGQMRNVCNALILFFFTISIVLSYRRYVIYIQWSKLFFLVFYVFFRFLSSLEISSWLSPPIDLLTTMHFGSGKINWWINPSECRDEMMGNCVKINKIHEHAMILRSKNFIFLVPFWHDDFLNTT